MKKVTVLPVNSFIAAGSNLGNRRTNIDEACDRLALLENVKVKKTSPVYETEPVGGPPQGKYLNAAWEIETLLTARDLLKALLSIETQMGRERSVPAAPRIIDLDILFYGSEIIREAGLEIPHPRLQDRWFVLKPLSDIAPDFIHPVLKKTVQNLLEKNIARNPKP